MKLAENSVSLGDVAKTTSNTYELVHDLNCHQEGLSMRMTAMEYQLADINRELTALVQYLRPNRIPRNESSKTVATNDDASNNAVRRKHKVAES
ncbi:unnamed protein product [Onchocerca flexuosa]|uniref:Elf4 domain-containing protein n=1 Tax=Onchocerca flexuosa TaxID=387005 RepID=A0A183HSS5_9BILA|nr:unnamed protein product [Onchocerca flexuosa]